MTARLCVVCAYELTPTELQTCAPCVSLVRLDLTQIRVCFALLPGLLGAPDGASLGAVMGGLSGEAALPGGDVLAMLGYGSAGDLWRGRPVTDADMDRWAEVFECGLCAARTVDPSRHLRDVHEDASWTRIPELFAVVGVTESIEGATDLHPSDPPAVAFELWQWRQDWAGIRGEESSHDHQTRAQVATQLLRERMRPSAGPSCASEWPSVPALVDWLGTRLGWAGSHHPAFDEFKADMERIRRRLEVVTQTYDAPERGESCPYDGGTLQREYGRQGRVDDWSCPRCDRVFNEVQYRLAVRGALEQREAVGG